MIAHLDVINFPLEKNKLKPLGKQNSRVVVTLLQGRRYPWRHEIQGTESEFTQHSHPYTQHNVAPAVCLHNRFLPTSRSSCSQCLNPPHQAIIWIVLTWVLSYYLFFCLLSWFLARLNGKLPRVLSKTTTTLKKKKKGESNWYWCAFLD